MLMQSVLLIGESNVSDIWAVAMEIKLKNQVFQEISGTCIFPDLLTLKVNIK